MTSESKLRNKQILLDPVALFSSLHPTGKGREINALEELWQRLKTLKKQRKEVELQSRIISGKIGTAKRQGRSIDSLKIDMQKQSSCIREIVDKLGITEKQILDLFDSGKSAESTEVKASCMDSKRIFRSPMKDYSAVSVSLLDKELHEWNSYVDRNPAASIYHRAEWREIIQQTYGHEGYYFLARDSAGDIVGVLPLIRLKSRLFGDLLVSMPYFKTGGAVADHPSVEQQLMQAANDHAATLNIEHIEYRDDILREGFPVRSEKVNMILSLPGSRDELWNSFSSKLRAQVRRPLRENPEILFGGKKHLNDFYAVYARNMRDLGSPAHSKQFIRNIMSSFPDRSWIICLRLNNRPIAAGFLISHSDTLEIPLASTVRDVNHLSMNMLLYWEVLKFAVENGFRYFNFGRSSKDAGTFRFKQQWGAKPRQLYWHYWLNEGNDLPSLNPHNPKYALAINTWKKLPLVVTKWLGPRIVRNLP